MIIKWISVYSGLIVEPNKTSEDITVGVISQSKEWSQINQRESTEKTKSNLESILTENIANRYGSCTA